MFSLFEVEKLDVLDVIKKRRSIRAFKKRVVSAGDVEMLIDAARWAPSAGNIQPWEFVVVRRPETKRRLVGASGGQSFIEEAPAVIVVCADEDRSSQGYGSRGKMLYSIQDTAAAIQNINLAACHKGLGTCWVGAFEEEQVREILKIPKGIRPVAMVPVGYPAELPSPRRVRPLNQIVHRELF